MLPFLIRHGSDFNRMPCKLERLGDAIGSHFAPIRERLRLVCDELTREAPCPRLESSA
jgi:hypothetical protein